MTSPSDCKEARVFFDKYLALPETERAGRIREIAEELSIDWTKAYRWVNIVRPRSIIAGKDWPFDTSLPDDKISPTDTIAKAEALAKEEKEIEAEEQDTVSAKDLILEGEDAETAELSDILSSGVARSLEYASPVLRSDNRAIYMKERDAYAVFLAPRKPPIIVPRETHEAMLSAYSNWDDNPIKANDIAAAVGLTAHEFNQYRGIFQWRRSSPPQDSVRLATLSEDDAIEELARLKEVGIQRTWKTVNDRLDKRDATKWRNLKTAVLDHLGPVIQEASSLEYRAPQIETKAQGATLVLPLNDWQVGSFANEATLRLGRQFDKEVFERMIENYVEQLVQYVLRQDVEWSRPYIALVGDLLHGLTGETVHGTKLAKHMREFDWEQARIALEALYRICDVVVDCFGGFELASVAGNHEGGVSQILAESLRQRYRNFNCDFHIPTSRTHQCMIGNSFFTFDHGASPDSNVKGGKIPRTGPARDSAIKTMVMARPDLLTEARSRRGGVYFVMGDHHHTIDESPSLVEIIKLPAIPSGDLYADENLWISRPAQAVLLVGEQGLCHMERFYFDNESVFPDGLPWMLSDMAPVT